MYVCVCVSDILKIPIYIMSIAEFLKTITTFLVNCVYSLKRSVFNSLMEHQYTLLHPTPSGNAWVYM